MKKLVLSRGGKIAMIITAAVLAVAGALVIFAAAGHANERKKFLPVDTQKIFDGVYALRTDFVNFYAVKSGERYILFDAGLDKKIALAGLEELNIASDAVAAVFFTHGHRDHVGSTGAYTNAEHYFFDGRGIRGVRTSAVSDGQTVEILGRSIKCVLTPGHTQNSMSFIVDGIYLFAGDTLSLKDGKAKLFNSFLWFFNKDNDAQKESLKKLAQIDTVTHVFSAHYGYCENAKTAFAEWR